MAYGVEIFNASGATRLGTDTDTTILVASGSSTYAGSTQVNITVPSVGGDGTSYAMLSGGNSTAVAGEIVQLEMTTQTNLRITWFSGATTSDYVAYTVYHR